MTLLERALKLAASGQPQYKVSQQSIETAELMIAWIMGQVDNAQVAKVLDITNIASVPQKVGPSLREMGKFGLIEITLKTTVD